MKTEKTISEENDDFMYVNDNGDLSLDLDDEGAHTNLEDKAPMEFDEEQPKEKTKSKVKEVELDQDEEDNHIELDDDDEEEVVEKKKEKKEDKKKEEVKPKKQTSKKGEASVDYNTVAKQLFDKGVLTIDLPESIESDEEMIDLFEKNGMAYKQDVDEHYNKNYGQLLDYLNSGGDIKKFIEVQKEYPYDTMTEDVLLADPKLKDQAYYDHYSEKGMDDKEINRNMKRAKDLEEFDEDVKDILPKLQNLAKKKKEAVIQTQIQEKKKQDLYIKELNDNTLATIDKLEEYMPGQKMTKKVKDEITKYATGNQIWDELSKDPVKTRVLLAQLKVLGLLDGKWDKVLDSATTTATKKVKSQIINYKHKGSDSSGDESEGSGNSEKTLAAFAKTFMRK